MHPTRRLVLTGTAAITAASFAGRALAQAAAVTDPRLGERGLGPVDAKLRVEEWFSFTCPHCARFAADIFPMIQANLIDTGKLRYVFREYPRDQVDLMAAMVARGLPPERYEPFMFTLLASQQRWAYDPSVDPKEEIAQMAALAGMPRSLFDATLADNELKAGILAAQDQAEKQYDINSTPTFIVAGKAYPGEKDYDDFAKMVGA